MEDIQNKRGELERVKDLQGSPQSPMNDLHSKILILKQELEQEEMKVQMEDEEDKLIIAFYCFRKKKMKSKILILTLLLGFVMHGFSMAEVVGISQQSWDSSTNDYWFNQKCDEVRQQEVYLNQYGVYLDNFINPASNPGALYLHKNKVLTRGNYLLYNPSNHVKGNGLIIFNRDLLGVR